MSSMKFEDIHQAYRLGSIDMKISLTKNLLLRGWSLYKISQYCGLSTYELAIYRDDRETLPLIIRLLHDYSVMVEECP